MESNKNENVTNENEKEETNTFNKSEDASYQTEENETKNKVKEEDKLKREEDDDNTVENSNDVETDNNELKITEEQIEKISNFIDTLKNDVKTRTKIEQEQSETINRMRLQIQEYDKDIFNKIKGDLLLEIISYYFKILNFKKKYEDSNNFDDLSTDIEYLEEELNNLLFNNGVTEIEEEVNAVLNRTIQRPIEKIETDEVKKHEVIKSIVKKGFKWYDKVILKQDVIVYKLREE